MKEKIKQDLSDLAHITRPVPDAIDTFFQKAGPWIILIAAGMLMVLIFQLNNTGEKVVETQAYTKVTNCIVNKASDNRVSIEEIEHCYNEVENELKIELDRF